MASLHALDVIEAGPEHAETIADIIRRSFSARPVLDPPSTATDETADSVRAAWVAAKPMVIVPPHEQPDTWAAGMHRLSMKAASAAQ